MSELAKEPSLQLQARLQRTGFTLDVNVHLPARGVSVLFGASGSGKTTCLRILAGLEPQATGRVAVADAVWQDSSQGIFVPTHQRAVGYVFQEASLFSHLNVEGNLKFGFDRTPPAQRRFGWDEGLELLGIAHLLKRMPHALSGGERQRVAIARALAASPRVLLMDEPLASLDAPRKAEILPWLERLHGALQIPVVVVTHSPEELARLADHVLLLDAGRVLAQGPVMDMLTRLDLPLAHGDAAAALVEACVGEDPPTDFMCMLHFAGGRLLLPQPPGTAAPAGTPVRIRIQARDVSVSLQMPEQTSVLNILPATVVDMAEDGLGQVLLGLRVSADGRSTRLLSRISLLSARRLGITPGLAVFAQIKGVAMVR
ncbi:MAG: molybdenum ABC transporter ATP-binding protein [Burkholderiales bacterium PBB3]|nr:MAG: molybdenum ABC transporter ATP-binding protein [Burkholderiales bacterium PBB3]